MLKQSQILEQVRYCAPDFKYDHKCEVYSFGILLWEIAEEKTPYEGYKEIVSIVEFVRSKKRETSIACYSASNSLTPAPPSHSLSRCRNGS